MSPSHDPQRYDSQSNPPQTADDLVGQPKELHDDQTDNDRTTGAEGGGPRVGYGTGVKGDEERKPQS